MSASPERQDAETVQIIQMTDCHLGTTKDFVLGGVNTYQSFSQVLSQVGARHSPELTVVTGDIACDGEWASYQLFADTMASSQLGYSWLPGNHDDFQLMSHVITQPFVRATVLGHWVAISLISAVPGSVRGELSENELAELESLLEHYQDQFVTLFVHHPPVDIHSQWLDQQKISNSAQLRALLARYANIRAIFTGHVHQQGLSDWFGIPVYSTPSTCFQFASQSDSFAISDLHPGYRWIDLCADGQIHTGIEHVRCDDIAVDRSCLGY
jgi:Icc protein